MKQGKNIAIAALLVASLGTVNSAYANQNSVESSVASALVEQGQKVATEMAKQLKQSIKAELSSFSLGGVESPMNKEASADSLVKQNETKSKTVTAEVE